jgi:hypothetical protein
MSQNAPTIESTHPVYFRDANAIGTVKQFGERGYIECGSCEFDHLVVAEKWDAIGEVEVDVLVDCR